MCGELQPERIEDGEQLVHTYGGLSCLERSDESRGASSQIREVVLVEPQRLSPLEYLSGDAAKPVVFGHWIPSPMGTIVPVWKG